MLKCQWELFDYWMIDNSHRVIFKPRNSGAHLVDITLEGNDISEIIDEVLRLEWTTGELMEHLNGVTVVK